jgi:hypothetical protein
LTDGEDPDVAFEERLVLPEAVPVPDPADPGVAALLDGMHRAFGVSYFKAAVPARVRARPLPEDDARFWDTLYTLGLGEFYYRNDLDPRGRVCFPRGSSLPSARQREPTHERVLLLAGGGKDSAVAREVVRHAGVSADALSLGTAPWITRSVEAMGLRHLVIRRDVDPTLFELNERGAWNGHVPISACIAFVASLVAYVGGYAAVIVANERSADEPNLVWNGIPVNHQWSKSLDFERAFQAWCARRWSGDPVYFSILRPLSEVRIAAAFARHAQYFAHFTSCNANFRYRAHAVPPRWCGRCPKCVFVQLALAPQLDDGTLDHVFGGQFFADPANRQILEALVGMTGFKPFECVGTATESRAALARLATQGRLAESVRPWYLQHVAPSVDDPAAEWRRATAVGGPHCIPPTWEARLRAYLGAPAA